MASIARPAPRRVSMAAANRLAAQLRTEAATPRQLDPVLAKIINEFDLSAYNVPAPAARVFIRDVLTASSLTGHESVRKHCRHLAHLASFALSNGQPLEIGTLLTTDRIDEYIRRGMAGGGDSDHNRAERRRRLLALSANVNPGPNSPARLTPIAHVAVKPPYTPREAAVIIRVAGAQPTYAKGRDLAAVVGLCLGAGADSLDLRHLYVRDITDLGDDGLIVHFAGSRPREVAVRARLEHLLRSALAGRPPGDLVLGKKLDRRHVAAHAVEGAALYRVPHIEPTRLRATWLTDLMTDTVPIGLILRAAGLQSARTLSELLPHTGPWLTHKGLTPGPANDVLRGGVL